LCPRLRRIAPDVLAAYGAGVFELAHGCRRTFHISRGAAMGFLMIFYLMRLWLNLSVVSKNLCHPRTPRHL
jgi:hypothetical protein